MANTPPSWLNDLQGRLYGVLYGCHGLRPG